MKHVLLAAVLTVVSASAFSADVAVSVSVGEPGFYGRLDIGKFPQPRVVYARPIVVEQPPEYVAIEPIYLHVPPGHEKHWNKHCREYNACGRPVYFVRDDWYNNEYVPRHRHGDHDQNEEHGEGKHRDKHKDRDHGDRDD